MRKKDNEKNKKRETTSIFKTAIKTIDLKLENSKNKMSRDSMMYI